MRLTRWKNFWPRRGALLGSVHCGQPTDKVREVVCFPAKSLQVVHCGPHGQDRKDDDHTSEKLRLSRWKNFWPRRGALLGSVHCGQPTDKVREVVCFPAKSLQVVHCGPHGQDR